MPLLFVGAMLGGSEHCSRRTLVQVNPTLLGENSRPADAGLEAASRKFARMRGMAPTRQMPPHLDQGPKKPPEFATTETIMSALMPRM